MDTLIDLLRTGRDRYGEEPRFSPQVDFARQQLEALEEAGVL